MHKLVSLLSGAHKRQSNLEVGFLFLIMPVMNCRNSCPGIAIPSHNHSFLVGSPLKIYFVAQTSGCIKAIVYARC